MPTEGPPATATVLLLPDGRSLAYAEYGDPDGVPVVAFHGTPGSRLQLVGANDEASAAGVRLIVPDRPGYGHSSYHRGRRLGDWAGDVAHLADHLGLDRFAVVGVSGGGPHALACAAGLGDRVTRVALVSPAGPSSAPALRSGLSRRQLGVLRLRHLLVPLLLPVIRLLLAAYRLAPRAALALARRLMPERDAEILTWPRVRDRLVAQAAVRPSPTQARAAVQDLLLFSSPWGLALDRVTQPVDVWHGDADTTVPVEHGRHLAEVLPHATLHELPGEGHLLVEERVPEVLAVAARP